MSHRRSARIQGSSKRPNYDVDNDTSSDESFEERPKAPRKKRVKNAELPVDRLSAKRRVRTTKSGAAMSTSTGAAQTSATQRRKAQKLGMVLNMPLDILFEVSSDVYTSIAPLLTSFGFSDLRLSPASRLAPLVAFDPATTQAPPRSFGAVCMDGSVRPSSQPPTLSPISTRAAVCKPMLRVKLPCTSLYWSNSLVLMP